MTNRRFYRCLVCVAMALGLMCTAWHGARAAHTAPPTDDALYNELAARGLDDLLDAAFKENNVPEQKRVAIRDTAALKRLADPNVASKLSAAEHDALLQTAVNGVDPTLASHPNLSTLSPIASAFADDGVSPAIEEMEDWGATPEQRASLKPLAEAAVKIYAATETLAAQNVTKTANELQSPDDKVHVPLYNKALSEDAVDQAKLALMKFSLAMVMTPGDPKRARLITDDMATYTSWDDPSTEYQASAEFYLARLHGLSYNDPTELELARKGLSQLVAGKPATTPPATQSQRFKAAIFQVLIDLDASDADSAAKDLAAARSFTAANKAGTDDDQKGEDALLGLMSYRIQAFLADKALPGPDKDNYNKQAVTELDSLMEKYPALRSTIIKHVLDRLSPNPDLTKLDSVLLSAMVSQGLRVYMEASGPNAVPSKDQPTLQRPRDAALELIDRYNHKLLTKSQVATPYYLVGVFDEYLNNPVDGADALINYIVTFENEKGNHAAYALGEAQSMIVHLNQTSAAGDPVVNGLFTRFLPVAIAPPFNHREWALQYAGMLVDKGDWNNALTYYQMVPASAPIPKRLTAEFGEIDCLSNIVDGETPPTPDQRKQYVAQIQSLANSIGALAKQDTDPKEQLHVQSSMAKVNLIAARLAYREQQNADRVLSLLDGYENSVKGLPDSQAMLNAALFLRVQAYLMKGDINQSTTTLLLYLGNTPTDQGEHAIHDMVDRINKDLDQWKMQLEQAQLSGDADGVKNAEQQVRDLSSNCAKLSGVLVERAEASTDPNVQAYIYAYRRFNAISQRQAAEYEEDPAAQQKDLHSALDLYKALQSSDNHDLFLKTPSGLKLLQQQPNPDDPVVIIGIALIEYDLADWKNARTDLLSVINNGLAGDGSEQYWECTYKWLESMQHLVDNKDPDVKEEDVTKALKTLYITNLAETGGPLWKLKFTQLRQQIMPDWVNPWDKSATQPSATQPAVQPAVTNPPQSSFGPAK